MCQPNTSGVRPISTRAVRIQSTSTSAAKLEEYTSEKP